MPRLTRRLTSLFPLAGAVLALTAGPCEDKSDGCAAEPLGVLVAFSQRDFASPPLVEVEGRYRDSSFPTKTVWFSREPAIR
jgi:hypothetical protein